jgi:hypothetical protein
MGLVDEIFTLVSLSSFSKLGFLYHKKKNEIERDDTSNKKFKE